MYNECMQYSFILGSHPALAKEEIAAVLPYAKTLAETKDALVVETDTLDPVSLQKRLGGTVKIGQVVGRITLERLQSFLSLDTLFQHVFGQAERKIVFGFSMYGSFGRAFVQTIHNLGQAFKKQLKGLGYSSRFVAGRDAALSSVIVTKNHLIERGADILLIVTPEAVWVAKALTVQPFEEYSLRDYGRPNRDPKSGMLPPKLAQMMLNMSRAPLDGTVLDPFCGSGTILQEALLMGFQRVIGSDRSEQAVRDTKANIEWLVKSQGIALQSGQLTIVQSDVRELHKKIPPQSVDTIVTEPYLGPVFKKKPDQPSIEKIRADLASLYLYAFETFRKIVKPKGSVVIIFPIWNVEKRTIRLGLDGQIQELGFTKTRTRENLDYGRPGQSVVREILIFQAK